MNITKNLALFSLSAILLSGCSFSYSSETGDLSMPAPKSYSNELVDFNYPANWVVDNDLLASEDESFASAIYFTTTDSKATISKHNGDACNEVSEENFCKALGENYEFFSESSSESLSEEFEVIESSFQELN
jgi:predicted YcjX-like family ATPase